MDDKVLVTYGSKYGATADIAEKIAVVLEKNGAAVEVADVKRVNDLNAYNAVVLGSAVYMGFWRREMTRFVEKNATELAQKMVWVFASGSTNNGDPVEEMGGRLYPPKLKPAMDVIMPVDITAFHGKIDPQKLSGFEKWVIKKVNAPTGDFRNWDMITAWTETISNNL